MSREKIIGIVFNNLSKVYKEKVYNQLLDSVTHDPNINEIYGEDFLEELMNDIIITETLKEKANYIEIAIRILDDLCLIDRDINKYNIYKLYNEYCIALKKIYINENNVAETLMLFANLGIHDNDILDDMISIFDNTQLLKLLSKMSLKVNNICKKYDDLFFELGVYKKKIRRYDVILHFHLLTHPKYSENIDIAGEYLKKYYNYVIICADWIFSSKSPNYIYVEDGIITRNEQDIFIKVGDILEHCKLATDSNDELMDNLLIISNKFKGYLNSSIIKDLVNKLYNGSDFLNLACTLPNLKE